MPLKGECNDLLLREQLIDSDGRIGRVVQLFDDGDVQVELHPSKQCLRYEPKNVQHVALIALNRCHYRGQIVPICRDLECVRKCFVSGNEAALASSVAGRMCDISQVEGDRVEIHTADGAKCWLHCASVCPVGWHVLVKESGTVVSVKERSSEGKLLVDGSEILLDEEEVEVVVDRE